MSETRQLENAYVIDVGYRKEQPIALVKMNNEYVIGFGYEIKDNKIDWQYGYYYLTDFEKAKTDFKRVLAGENLADTFSEKEENKIMEDYQFYSVEEVMKILKDKEKLLYVDDGCDEVVIKFEDLPDVIVDINTKSGMTDLKIYDYQNPSMTPLATTMGIFLDKCNPDLREKIIDRFVKLQQGEIEVKDYKMIDEYILEEARDKLEQEKKTKAKRNKEARYMEVKINKDIREFSESIFFGLSLRQFIFSVIACIVAVVLYFVLKPYLGLETLSWVCILGAAPFAVLGFVKYNGMTAEKFIVAVIKSEFLTPKKLTFKATNIYAQNFKPTIDKKLKQSLLKPQKKKKEKKDKKKKKEVKNNENS